MQECYYVPKELLHLVIGQIPDAIALDFSQPIEDQLYAHAARIRDAEPRTIFSEDLSDADARQLSQRVISAHRRFQMSLATREVSWPIWLRNSLENYEVIKHRGIPIDEVDWPHQKKPLIVVGNGPSLEITLPKLAKVQDEYAIMVCWHALTMLLSYDIQPQTVIHIDKLAPSFFNPGSLPPETPLIVSPVSHPSFIQHFAENPVYYVLTEEHEAHIQWAGFLGKKTHLPALGTILAAGLRCGLYWGHRQMILTGSDLSFPTQEAALNYNLMVQPEALKTVPNQQGNPCYSFANLLQYREFLQTLAHDESKNAQFYNASPGGLPLLGFGDWQF